jgi:NTP pyrophosphatase (non-canonical NTP hydrolase)
MEATMQQDIDKLMDMVKKFCEDRDWDQFHNPKDLAIGLSTESNELLDLFRFKTEKQMQEMMNDNKKRELISEELSDILFFLLRFSQLYEFDLGNGLIDKIKKNDSKYPIDTVKGKNQKYTEY